MDELQKIRQDLTGIEQEITRLYQKRSRLMEQAAAKEDAKIDGRFGFRPVSSFDFNNVKVVFQGVEGAYSQQALQEFCGTRAKSFHVETWRDAMEAIAGGDATYAVLPIENSSAGIVSENFDLLTEYQNVIIGEQIIKIDHCLIGLKDVDISGITDVYSHPQALMQCSKFLEAHPKLEKHSMKNTAGAAKKIKEDGCLSKAAIASALTADIYGLQILQKGIQNHTSNSTRFIIVTGQKVFRKDAGKISISFEIPHESGSLYRALSHFIIHNLNMNKIESRPIQGKTWEYRFFIDIEGNLMDTAVQDAFRGLKEETEGLRILGNY